MLLSGAQVHARQESPCQQKVQIDYTRLEATGALSRWTRLGGGWEHKTAEIVGPEDMAITGQTQCLAQNNILP